MLSKLPEYLIGAIISAWLELADLARLDSSTNTKDRYELLSIMSAKWFEFLPTQLFCSRSRNQKLTWTNIRKISLLNVQIAYQYIDYIDRDMLLTCLNHGKLRSLHVTTTGMESTRIPAISLCLDQVWRNIASGNCNLTDLEISDVFNMETFLEFVSTNAPLLSNLQLTSCSRSPVFLHYITPVLLRCTAIRRVVVKQSPYHCYIDGISVIINTEQHAYISTRQINYDEIDDFEKDLLVLNSIYLAGFRTHGVCGKGCQQGKIIAMLETKRTLREILITNLKFNDVKRLVNANPHLHKLEVRFNENKSSRLAGPDYRDVFANSTHQIVSLRASHNTWHGDGHVKIATINAILKACPQLTDFEFKMSENDCKGKKLRRQSGSVVNWTDGMFTMFY